MGWEVYILIRIGMALCPIVEYYCFKIKMTEKFKPGDMVTFAKHCRQKWYTVLFSVVFLFYSKAFQPSSRLSALLGQTLNIKAVGC
jgi:hypothetical protein